MGNIFQYHDGRFSLCVSLLWSNHLWHFCSQSQHSQQSAQAKQNDRSRGRNGKTNSTSIETKRSSSMYTSPCMLQLRWLLLQWEGAGNISKWLWVKVHLRYHMAVTWATVTLMSWCLSHGSLSLICAPALKIHYQDPSCPQSAPKRCL